MISMFRFIAHRGNDDGFLENTKEAILNALSKPYIDGVEFDIRITKDNHFIIHHNATILDSKKSGLIKNMTLRQLKKVEFEKRKKKYKLATLKEVLKEINNQKIIIIEIKEEIDYSLYQKKKLIRLLNNYSNLNIYLVSFNYKLISSIQKIYENSGLLIGKVLNRNKDITKFPFLLMPLDFYKKYEGVQEIFIWTINEARQLKDIKEKDYIITDKAYELFMSPYNHHKLL